MGRGRPSASNNREKRLPSYLSPLRACYVSTRGRSSLDAKGQPDMATKIKAWKVGEKGAPFFPEDFEIVKKAVLQVTDIKTNHNKYYAIELHRGKLKGKQYFRIFTHYGRTDDLETNPDAGQKECRYFATQEQAEAEYDAIYRQKTSSRKGYQEVALASTKIGSQQARGTSSGDVDEQTLKKLKSQNGSSKKTKTKAVGKSKLPPAVQELVRYLYDEAKTALTTTVAASITANGIETPLGILTLGQIEKGEEILDELYDEVKKKKKSRSRLEKLTSAFYTAIPHRIGRSRAAVDDSVIDTLAALQRQQDTLQLMKDMLQVNGSEGNVLYNAEVDQEYEALGCQIEPVERSHSEFKKMEHYLVDSQVD